MITVKNGNEEIPISHIKSANRRFPMNDIPEMNMMVARHKDNPAYPYLNEEEIIITSDGHEWRIKVESEVTHYKNLNAQHILLDLADMEFNQLLSGIYTPASLLSTVLGGTGFILDLDATDLNSVTVNDFGRKNPWQMLKDSSELLNAEFTVLPGRIIRVRKAFSIDRGQQYRYGYNLKNVIKKTDSTDIVTHVTVNYGEDYSLSETFVSSRASDYSRSYYGDIINDERITDRETAKRRAEAEFKDIDISYELDIAQIGNDVELGETVHTIYEPLNDLNITTRIMKLRDDWNGEEFILTEATVGNYVFKTANQILQDQIKDTEKDVTEKIDETKEVINKNMNFKFQETEEKMLDQYTTVTAEYNAAITLSATEMRTDMNAKIDTVNSSLNAQYNKVTAEYNSSISQTAQQIRNELSASVTSIGNDLQNVRNSVSSVTQTASLIESRVNSHETSISNQGSRISSAESSISQQASQISQKVSATDFNGANLVSMINQTPSTIKLQAKNIEMQGAVSVLSDISGNMGTITAGTLNLHNAIYVGDGVHLRGSGRTGLYFPSWSQIFDDGGGLQIEAFNGITLAALSLDLSNISGPINWGSHRPTAVWG